jgi:hypothetical protein
MRRLSAGNSAASSATAFPAAVSSGSGLPASYKIPGECRWGGRVCGYAYFMYGHSRAT